MEQNKEQYYKITIKEIFVVIFNWKWLLILFLFIGLLLGGFLGYFTSQRNAEVVTIVEFQWEGISRGEYPNGERFDYGSAFDATIYGSVIENLSLDLSVSDLQKYFTFIPIVPANILELTERAMLQNIDYSYFPTTFKLSLRTGPLGLNADEGSKILTMLIDVYKETFQRQFISKTIILDFTNEDFSNYDYFEILEILVSQISIINNAVNQVLPGGSEFVSSELSIGFSDILVRTDLISNILLQNMESRINNYLLSKDESLLLVIYQYRIEKLEFEMAKEEEIKTELQNIISTYNGGTSTIIIPGMDVENQIAVEPYLNDLYKNLVETQGKISQYKQDIAYYTLIIDRLMGNDPSFIITPEKKLEEISNLEVSIVEASSIISDIVYDTEILLSEYHNYVIKGIINPIIPPQSDSGLGIFIYSFLGIVVFGCIGIITVFSLDYRRKHNKNQI